MLREQWRNRQWSTRNQRPPPQSRNEISHDFHVFLSASSFSKSFFTSHALPISSTTNFSNITANMQLKKSSHCRWPIAAFDGSARHFCLPMSAPGINREYIQRLLPHELRLAEHTSDSLRFQQRVPNLTRASSYLATADRSLAANTEIPLLNFFHQILKH